MEYSVFYHFLVVLIRTITSGGSHYLSFSFYGKTIQGYIKVVVLVAAIYCAYTVFRKIISSIPSIHWCMDCFLSLFSTTLIIMESMYIVLIGWPIMGHVVFIGGIAGLISIVYAVISIKNGCVTKSNSDKPTNKDYLFVLLPLLLFAVLFILVGPTEMIAYNRADFIFSYSDAILHLIAGCLIMGLPAVILVTNNCCLRTRNIYISIVSIYDILAYVQSLFLNGNLQHIDGGIQSWTRGENTVNILIICVLVVGLFLFRVLNKYGKKVLMGFVIYILAIQLFTGIYILITTDVMHSPKKQLVEDGALTLSTDNNVVVFILDAYDVQMLKAVTDNDPEYLNPLHDFVYYDNMSSRYTATDGSLPYLLTGADISDPDVEKDQDIWYENSTFLSDIKAAGYDIRILTDLSYVKKLPQGTIDNLTENTYCRLDMEKTIALFIRCMKYKSMPYIVKPLYRYEAYDITNTVVDTDIYVFGTDAAFDYGIESNGTSYDSEKKTFRIYHLYGAHSPYYLTEDAKVDYNSTPIAQWRGSLKIVYDYIEALKNAGIYDNTTLIIMADHGFNNTQRKSVAEAGIEFDESRSNPIFIIKKAGDSRDSLLIDDKEVTHDVFFDTIRESMGMPDNYYGSIWD